MGALVSVILACAMTSVNPAVPAKCTLEASGWRFWAPEIYTTEKECEDDAKDVLKEIVVPHIKQILPSIKGYTEGGLYGFTFYCYDQKVGAELKTKFPDYPPDDEDGDPDSLKAPSKEPGAEDFLNNK